jgi:hypothetical protein
VCAGSQSVEPDAAASTFPSTVSNTESPEADGEFCAQTIPANSHALKNNRTPNFVL